MVGIGGWQVPVANEISSKVNSVFAICFATFVKFETLLARLLLFLCEVRMLKDLLLPFDSVFELTVLGIGGG